MSAPSPRCCPGHATDVLIVGGGAAGLMAGAMAAEAGLRAAVLEKRHRPGLKLLMCGNNRCNLTHDLPPAQMLVEYGDEYAAFLETAVNSLSPAALRRWFAAWGLATRPHADRRVFPVSEKADDVLHALTDRLARGNTPLALNAPVIRLRSNAEGFTLDTPTLELNCRFVLIATGGVSYPKTGSVGDGQRLAKQLGHRVVPYRPGLAGLELDPNWLHSWRELSIPHTTVTVRSDDRILGRTAGEILLDRRCARGPAMVDASRIMAHAGAGNAVLEIDLAPGLAHAELKGQLEGMPGDPRRTERFLARLLPQQFAAEFGSRVMRDCRADAERMTDAVKAWQIRVVKVRPLKEAMVTVGGVARDEITSETMESRRCPGLFLAGEVIDVDGPTGGFNLHIAFATARLAVSAMAERLGAGLPTEAPPARGRDSKNRKRRPRTGRRRPGPGRSTAGR